MTASSGGFGLRASVMASAVAVLLVGCTEPEEILRGPREDIRGAETSGEVENRAVRISLPRAVQNASWEQSPGQPTTRTTHAALSSAPSLLWSTRIGNGDNRKQRVTAAPVVGGGRIYTLDSAALVSAVAPTGAVVWQTSIRPTTDSEGDATGGGLAYADGVIYVSSGFGVVTALEASTGAEIWRQELEATGSGSPTIRDGLLYLIAGDETAWVLDTKDGRIAWQLEASPSVSNILGAPAPVVGSEIAVFAFGSGDVVGTFRRGGFRRWLASVTVGRTGRAMSQISDVTGAPFLEGNRVYVGNHSGRTAAFNISSGERLWTAFEGTFGPVWVAGGSLFMVNDRNRLMRLDASDGSVIWSVELAGYLKDKPRKRAEIVAHHGPVLAGGQLVVASNDGLLRFFDPVDGALTRSVEIKGGATTEPVVAGGTLYVVTSDGALAAYR
ncbi:PQQ-like beta-propeller repeat protein [Tritonibacter horizontis]|uniref:Outer membrane protein assembly factor BamB n=1 Tax=Tritonibacter horizontis TaxID=1768241 RepID=A0A132C169_9RHOB|nr:PQQ-like beta-propeller repeat protein [Tritonibacter horizontis]KUP94348.1 outer membrane protein assembly factor BamB precursor [Tritonibacter horizontis]